MQIVILIPAFLAFLYTLYKLVKDDYVFIRKNISAEQMFDSAIILAVISLITSRLFYFSTHSMMQQTNWLQFFTGGVGGFSLFGGIVGGLVTLYFFGKYRKLPLGRLFDFFTFAFVVALPVGILSTSIFFRDYALWLRLGSFAFYFFVMLWFLRFLYSRLMSRVLKEGTSTILFMMLFSVASLITAIFLEQQGKIVFINADSISLLCLLLFSFFLFFRQASSGLVNKKR